MKILKVILTILTVGLAACSEKEYYYGTEPDTSIPSLGTPANNEIWCTTTDGRTLSFDDTAFNTAVIAVENFEYGIGIIRFEEDLVSIGESAFNGCHNIFNLSLPNSVAEIGERAFYDCKNMESLTLGSGLSHCGKMAFDGCYNLRSLHIPSIYNWCNIAFDSPTANPLNYAGSLIINKAKVTALNIPEGIEHISSFAFYNNSELKSVSFASSVKSVGDSAFYGCSEITKVKIQDLHSWCRIQFKNEESNPLSIAEVLQYSNDKAVSTVSLTAIEHISPYAFINCSTITSFTADDSLVSIGVDAFRNCSSLSKVSLGSGVGAIGKHAFMNCKALKSVTCLALLPPILENRYIFEGNKKGRKFYVPSSVVEDYKTADIWSNYADTIYEISNQSNN